ncbi:MAG: hypothetical protein OCD00_19905, partial [Colwellia sp.]
HSPIIADFKGIKMKKHLKIIPIFILSLSAIAHETVISNGDEPVNCGDKTVGYQSIYGGLAQCDAEYTVKTCESKPNGFTLITTPKSIPLSEDFVKHDKQTVTLSKLITYSESYGAGPIGCTLPQNVNEWVDCSTELDYLGEEPIKKHSCDYTPEAAIKYYYIGAENGEYYVAGKKAVVFSASDSDGTISKTEAWIDGVPVSFGTHFLKANFGPVWYNVRIKVTDNDGYITEATSIIPVSSRPVCYDSNGILKVCEGET